MPVSCQKKARGIEFSVMDTVDRLPHLHKLAVMGGTFDPIHHGHLFAAEEVASLYELPLVLFVPCRQPPHKDPQAVTPAEHRLAMTQLAVANNRHFAVSRMELERPGPSYTIDTLRQLRQQLGPETEIFFITGTDAVLEILSWREPEALLAEYTIIAVHRPGYDVQKIEEVLGPQRAARIRSLAIKTLDISSTELRQRVAQGRSIRYLTPDAVVDYIYAHQLYHHGETPTSLPRHH